jgi:hypothetical protein
MYIYIQLFANQDTLSSALWCRLGVVNENMSMRLQMRCGRLSLLGALKLPSECTSRNDDISLLESVFTTAV